MTTIVTEMINSEQKSDNVGHCFLSKNINAGLEMDM